jgi:hypothetical protein
MSRLGLVCLSLVLIGLAAESYLAAKLGMRKGEVEDQLRKAITDSEKAIDGHGKAKTELEESRTKLAGAKLGWGYEWTFPPGGNVGSVQIVGGRLAVAGLGTSNGLTANTVTDSAGAQKLVPPIVHVFTSDGQGKSVYIGEFVAGIGPNELTESTSTLTPTWNVAPNELATWNFNNGVRLRSQIPAGARTGIESLHQTIQRTLSQLSQTAFRIEEQKRLTAAAEVALEVRKKELLGDPAAVDNADHPEYKLGLVQALEDLEEERNAVQAGVDELRRLLKLATEQRFEQLENLKQVVQNLRNSATKLSQRDE